MSSLLSVDLIRRFGVPELPAEGGVARVRAVSPASVAPGGRKRRRGRRAYYLFIRTAGAELPAPGTPGVSRPPPAAYSVSRLGVPGPGYAVVSGAAAECSCECLGFLSGGSCRHVRFLNRLRMTGQI